MPHQAERPRVLIVDDEAALRHAFARNLEAVGYARALEICVTARMVGAREAADIGLATAVELSVGEIAMPATPRAIASCAFLSWVSALLCESSAVYE